MLRREGPAALPARAPRPRRGAFPVACLALASLAAALLGAEALVRARGFEPWTPDPGAAEVEPGGSLYRPDPLLGFVLRPGAYDVTLPSGLRFHVTHDAEGRRVTHAEGQRVARAGAPAPEGGGAAAESKATSRSELWIFGDSFTYGWAVNDEQTYPWLLQTAFPRHRVLDFAVGGYGTLHALLQLRAALRTRPPPALVLLAHNFFHDPRNTFSRLRRREVAPWNRLGPIQHPIARIAPDGKLRFASAPVAYRELPLMRRSALAHLVATAWDLLEDRRLRSHEVTRALLAELIASAGERGVPVLVATLEAWPANAAILDYARSLGARATDVSVDLRRPENTNLPHDGHPSPLAHRRYAKRLAPAIRDALRESDGGPRGHLGE
jgi:lysophospholipase L1-like esterase